MAIIEQTQFSVVEFKTFLAESRPAVTPREKYMVAFAADLSVEGAVAKLGGWDNVQRVRVLGDPYGIERFEYVTKLPLSVLEAKRRQAGEEERRVKLAALKAAKTAPKKPEPKKLDPAARRRFLCSSEGKKAAFDEALKQDRASRARKPSKNPCADIKVANDLCPISSAPGGGRFISLQDVRPSGKPINGPTKPTEVLALVAAVANQVVGKVA